MAEVTQPGLAHFYQAYNLLAGPWPAADTTEQRLVQTAAYGPDGKTPVGLLRPKLYSSVSSAARRQLNLEQTDANTVESMSRLAGDLTSGWRDNQALRHLLARYITWPLAVELYASVVDRLPYISVASHRARTLCFAARLRAENPPELPQTVIAMWNDGSILRRAPHLLDSVRRLGQMTVDVFGGTLQVANGERRADFGHPPQSSKWQLHKLPEPIVGSIIVVTVPHRIQGGQSAPDMDVSYVSPWEYPAEPMKSAGHDTPDRSGMNSRPEPHA